MTTYAAPVLRWGGPREKRTITTKNGQTRQVTKSPLGYTKAQAAHALEHSCRSLTDPEGTVQRGASLVHPELTHLNEVLVPDGNGGWRQADSYAEVLERFEASMAAEPPRTVKRKMQDGSTKDVPSKLRSDAKVLTETIIQLDPAYTWPGRPAGKVKNPESDTVHMSDQHRAETRRLLMVAVQSALRWQVDNDQDIVAVTLQWDETHPHAQFFTVPKDDQGLINASARYVKGATADDDVSKEWTSHRHTILRNDLYFAGHPVTFERQAPRDNRTVAEQRNLADEQARNRERSRELDDREQALQHREDELSSREGTLQQREADLRKERARLGEQAADLETYETELDERALNIKAAARQEFKATEKPALVAAAKVEASTAADQMLVAARLKAQQLLDEAAAEAAAVKTNSRRPLGRDLHFLNKTRTRKDGTTYTLRQMQAREEKTEFGLLEYMTGSYTGDPKAGAHNRERTKRQREMAAIYAAEEQAYDAQIEARLINQPKATERVPEGPAERDNPGLER